MKNSISLPRLHRHKTSVGDRAPGVSAAVETTFEVCGPNDRMDIFKEESKCHSEKLLNSYLNINMNVYSYGILFHNLNKMSYCYLFSLNIYFFRHLLLSLKLGFTISTNMYWYLFGTSS